MALSVTKQGAVKLVWGTDGILGGALATRLCEEVTFKPQVERSKVPDNNGFTVARNVVDDGFEATAKLPMEVGVTYPVEGAVILVKRVGIDTVFLRCLVDDVEPSYSRKKEAMISIKFCYFPAMTY